MPFCVLFSLVCCCYWWCVYVCVHAVASVQRQARGQLEELPHLFLSCSICLLM